MGTVRQDAAVETWTVRKPAVSGRRGLVASHHHLASDIGAAVLADGGNAVDAAIAAGMAIGVAEPWMSGLGGGGFMLVYRAAERSVHAVEFGMRAPLHLDPADYPLAPAGADADLFAWPAVVEDRNVVGPLSIAVPGYVAGYALALERFGTRPWADALAPAIDVARAGMSVDWYATLKIASAAQALANYPESARVYLPGGHVPVGAWGGPPPTLHLGRLGATLERLAAAGPRDFYEGDVAGQIAADAAAAGARLDARDLAAYEARVTPIDGVRYRGSTLYAAPGLSAGPTLRHALALFEAAHEPGASPDAPAYAAYASALDTAYAERLRTLGDDAEDAAGACTTHLSVVDGDGNMVALTQTLLSVFGSKVVLPGTGILMNNGIMWFDPRPGRPNSMRAGRRPLSNMCPTIVERGDGLRAAMGGSGGRRIMPAVMQLLSFLVDYGMSVEDACHQPRIDASAGPAVTVDARLGEEVAAAVAREHDVSIGTHSVYPVLFACPNMVTRAPGGDCTGGAFVMSPWAKVSAA